MKYSGDVENTQIIADELGGLHKDWTTIDWRSAYQYKEGSEVYSAIIKATELAQEFAANAKAKHSESSSKRKARELREKADELLVQAKELEEEL